MDASEKRAARIAKAKAAVAERVAQTGSAYDYERDAQIRAENEARARYVAERRARKGGWDRFVEEHRVENDPFYFHTRHNL